MAFVEIDISHTLPTWTTITDGEHAGRLAIVLEESPGSGALLLLPTREAWEAAHRLAIAADRMYPQIRAHERGQVHYTPGLVIAVPEGEWPP